MSDPANAIDEQACRWAASLDRGLSAEEHRDLEAWLAGDGGRRGALLRAQAAWHVLDRTRALSGQAVDQDDNTEAPSRRRLLQMTGGGLAAAMMAGAAWQLLPRGQRYTTVMGEVSRLPLQDGSLAVVNSDSGIRVDYSSHARDVELARGEAWFQVAKNRARPFTVAAGAIRVQAVGTAFDVRRRPGVSEILVTEGVVKIWSTGIDGAPVHVSAGHRALISDRMGLTVDMLSAAQLEQQLAWREGRIILDDMTLAAAAAEFNRYNAVQLTVDPALADRRLVGMFRTNDVDGFTQASAALVNGRVQRRGNIILITQ